MSTKKINLPQLFFTRLKSVFEGSGKSQKEIAELLKISPGYVTQLLQAKNNPSPALIDAICIKFNIRYDWLVTGTGEMFEQQAVAEPGTPYFEQQLSEAQQKVVEFMERNKDREWEILARMMAEWEKAEQHGKKR